MVKHHLDDCNVGVIHPRTPLFIEANMRHGVRLCYHGPTLPECARESRRIAPTAPSGKPLALELTMVHD